MQGVSKDNHFLFKDINLFLLAFVFDLTFHPYLKSVLESDLYFISLGTTGSMAGKRAAPSDSLRILSYVL